MSGFEEIDPWADQDLAIEMLRRGECLGLVPDTMVACGEGGNYCSEACSLRGRLRAMTAAMQRILKMRPSADTIVAARTALDDDYHHTQRSKR